VQTGNGGPPAARQERAEILSSETIMPTGAPHPSRLTADSLDQGPSLRSDTVLASNRSSVVAKSSPLLAYWWLWAGAAVGAGVLLLLVLVIGIVALSNSSSSKEEQVADKQTEKAAPGVVPKRPKQPDDKAGEGPKQGKKPDNPGGGPKKPVVKALDFPPPLEPTGPKETDGLFLMPTIAPDARVSQLKSGDRVFLSDLKEFAFKTTPLNWPFAKAGHTGDPKDPDSRIQVNGMSYPKGLGMHPPNTDYIRICYALGGRARSLHGAVALDDGDDPPWGLKTTTFVVIGDGQVLWRSQGIKDRGVIEPLEVDVRGIAVLELRVYTDYNGANGCRAAWLDPYVVAGDRIKPRPKPKQPDKGAELPRPQGGKVFPGTAKVVGLRASHQMPDVWGKQPAKAFDGDLATQWDAGKWPPAWIEADLGKAIELKALRLVVAQRPDCETVHEVWIANKPIGDDTRKAIKIHTFNGFTKDREVLSHSFPPGITARYVQIRTTQSRSWVAWWDIAIDAAQ
jgi:hypothetical protein